MKTNVSNSHIPLSVKGDNESLNVQSKRIFLRIRDELKKKVRYRFNVNFIAKMQLKIHCDKNEPKVRK